MRALYAIPLLLAAGCYHPKIADGAFLCGEGMSCPEGFVCASDNHCRATAGQGSDLGNAGDLGGDMAVGNAFVGSGALGALDLTGMSGELDVNTENGEMILLAGGADGGAGMTLVQANAMGFQNLAQPSGGPHVGIWSFSQLVIPKAVTVKPSSQSQSVCVLASTGDLNIAGNIDFRLFGGFGGLPGMPGTTRNSGAASNGGGAQNNGNGAGGGGGGYKDVGMSGAGTGAGIGGALYGMATLVPIHAGSGGGGGGASFPMDGGTSANPAGRGGAGGGAVALFGASVTVSGTIDVRGNPGADALTAGSTIPAGGGGGGSGGSILMSGISVVLNSGHDLLVAGGSGGRGTLGDGGLTGNAGGAGSSGRIWIGSVNLTGSVQSDTPAVLGGANSAVKVFPR